MLHVRALIQVWVEFRVEPQASKITSSYVGYEHTAVRDTLFEVSDLKLSSPEAAFT